MFIGLFLVYSSYTSGPEILASYNYPVEQHSVETTDNYILKLVHIPNSPNATNAQSPKPVVFIMHGMSGSSDAYLLIGPSDGLPYLLADAGFDVWLGNSRGNTYSRLHKYMDPKHKSFWNFSWHEMGTRDLPASIDYVLDRTCQRSLHYVGYSQGATQFLVMLSMRPEYNEKIKTSHLTAPAAFLKNMNTGLGSIVEKVILAFDDREWFSNRHGITSWASIFCSVRPMKSICTSLFMMVYGINGDQISKAIIMLILKTLPAGISSRQLKHYLQLKMSSRFCMYDHGKKTNRLIYGSSRPPDYPLKYVKPKSPINLYYSSSDFVVSKENVLLLAEKLSLCELHHIPYYSHIEFQFARAVGTTLNRPIVKLISKYETDRNK
ncbi:lipase 3-like isoform X1 [Drosophila miranda]|uniref:lipase 3-like isoform X1 n=1 Tax=Drosophila miranda TaxID=7229 RepID=UPI0007E62A11|nr:lipase 3-like isoform X1 [Drosophila miranda]